MKKFLSLFMSVAMLMSIVAGIDLSAYAATTEYECGDNIIATYDSSALTLTLEGSGAMTDYDTYTATPWYSNRTKIKSVTIDDRITTIGAYAFYGFNNASFTSITLPSALTSINQYAFYNCSKITSVVIPDSVTTIGDYAFRGCTNLASITFNEGLKTIGEDAFYGLTKLTTLTLPSTVTSLGTEAFRGCTGLTSVTLNEGLLTIGDSAFYGLTNTKFTSIKIPDTVTSIGDSAFYGCTKLTSIDIPGSVESIGDCAFCSCSALESITLHEGLQTIGDYAFTRVEGTSTASSARNTTVTSIEIPSTVKSIGQYAFKAFTALETVTFNEGLVSIGASAFNYCTSLTEIVLPDTLTTLGKNAFSSCSTVTYVKLPNNNSFTEIPDTAFNGLSSLTSISIPESITSIGGSAFYNCSSLTSIDIPGSVESIGTYAFYNCYSLEEITFNEGLETIGDYAFSAQNANFALTKITSIEIPSSVTSIGVQAFRYCTSLKTAVIKGGAIGKQAFYDISTLEELTLGENVTSIGESAFEGSSSLLEEIIIPDATTSIGKKAFYNCESAKTIVIGEGVTSLGNQCFYVSTADTSQLETLIINAKQLSELAQNDSPFGKAGQASDGVTVIFGDEVENIPAYLFSNYNTTTNTINNARYNITSVTFGKSVSYIGNGAFYNARYIEELIFNSESIGDLASGAQAFYMAGSEVEDGITVTFSDSVTRIPGHLFYDSSTTSRNNYSANITTLNLGENIESIGAYAFYYISTITDDLVIPDSVETIEASAFYACTGLTSVTLGTGVTTVETFAFTINTLENLYINSYCPSNFDYRSFASAGYSSGSVAVTFGETVESVPTEFLLNCTGLFTSVTFEGADTVVEEYAFSGWSYLTSIEFPANITKLNDGILYSCTALQDVEIPETVTDIGGFVFAYSGLTSIYIPDSVTSIGDSAFYGTALESVTIPDSVTDLGTSVFEQCDSLTSVTFGSGIDAIPSKTFRYCSALTDLTLPDTITSIGSYAFYGSAITNITLSENLESIGLSAFGYCENLASLDIPSSVTSIAAKAFVECTALEAGTEDNKLVSYNGTEYQWDTLVSLGDDNEALAYNERIQFIEHTHDFTDAVAVSNNDGTHTYTCTAEDCDENPDGYQTTEDCTYTYSVTTEPTYTSTGVGTYTCSVCGYSYTVEIAALEAPADDPSTDTGSGSTGSTDTSTSSDTSTAAAVDTIPIVTGLKFKSRTTSSITFTWIKTDGIKKYVIYQYDYSKKKYVKLATVGNVTEYTATGLKAGTKYKFKVAAVKDGKVGRRGTCYVKTVTKPKKVTVKSVKASTVAIKVNWNKRNSDGYQIQYATNKKFTKNKTSVTVKGKKNTSKKISNLKSGKTYYVRVRAYKKVNGKKVYGKWSTVQVVKTK